MVYSDWWAADAPRPEAVLVEALGIHDCVGVLIDTWDKSRPGALDLSWRAFIGRAQASGRIVALAGRLDLAMIRRLAPLGPDLFAVRGAACAGADRLAVVDRERVAELVRAAAG